MNAAVTETTPRKITSLRRLLPHISPYRGLIAGWLGFLALSSAATLALPVAVRYMIDGGFSGADPGAIDRYFMALLGVAVLLAVATAMRFFFVTLLGERVVADLRQRLYKHLLRLDIAFYESTRVGELLSRLTADAELVQTVVGSSASIALRSAVMLLGAAVALVITSPSLAGMTFLAIPLVILPIVVFGRRVRGLSRESQDRTADASAVANEALHAIHTVQSFVREGAEAERYSQAISRGLSTARRRIGWRALLTAIVIVLVFGAITLVLWIGAKSVVADQMKSGVLGQFVLYAVIAASSVGALTEVWGEVLRAAGAMERISELLAVQPTICAPPGAAPVAGKIRGAIRFDNVEFRYPSRQDKAALHHFDLSIAPGETVALVGPSGAGKSTVFQLLLRFYDPLAGSISVDGRDLRAMAPDDLRNAIALVPQDTIVFGATALDNIRYGRAAASEEEAIAAARVAEAHEFLDTQPQGYATYLGERGVRLSGGQRQRIAIARAVLKDAPILLLDEATSSLDAHSEAAIRQALDRLVKGRTTLIIAHRLATVQKADRIVVLDHGRVVASGTHLELIAQGGLYAELARLQFAA